MHRRERGGWGEGLAGAVTEVRVEGVRVRGFLGEMEDEMPHDRHGGHRDLEG